MASRQWPIIDPPDRDAIAHLHGTETARALADADWRWNFPALFTLRGGMIDARRESSRNGYGWRWTLADGTTIVESTHDDPNRRREADAARGVYVGRIEAPATLCTGPDGTPVIVRADHGWSAVIVIDDGHTITTIDRKLADGREPRFHDRAWAMPFVASSVRYIDQGAMVTAAYVADPHRDPAEAIDDVTYTPIGEFPPSVLIGWIYKHTRYDTFAGLTGWFLHDTDEGTKVPVGTRKPEAMEALREVAQARMDRLVRMWG